MATIDSFSTATDIVVSGTPTRIYSLPALERAGHPRVARLPFALKILLENLLRNEDGRYVRAADIAALADWDPAARLRKEIAFTPARVLLQDFTGVPAVVDLAAMRDAVVSLGGDPALINPLQPVELVIDHSVQVDVHGRPDAFELNADLEFTGTASATSSCGGARTRSPTSGWSRPTPASSTRSTSSTWRAWCSTRRATGGPSRTPTRWWAPTRTPPW